MWTLKRYWHYVLLSICTSNVCGIANTNFNANIREYSVIGHDVSNSSSIKTLQKDIGRYASFAPANSPANYKEVPDSVLSSSSHSRGLLHHEHPAMFVIGYVISDYEDIPHYGHDYEYHIQEPHDYKYYDHYNGHHYSGHHLSHGHGHHHKHYEHALAAKTLLWPIAGIALLGAAAALVSNPVLLQLGVVSGRRRRDTDQVPNPDKVPDIEKLLEVKLQENLKEYGYEDLFKKRKAKWKAIKVIKNHTPKTTFIKKSNRYIDNPKAYSKENYDDRFVPIPIIIKNNK